MCICAECFAVHTDCIRMRRLQSHNFKLLTIYAHVQLWPYSQNFMLQTRLHLTEGQRTDLMHLRRLFYAKMGALKRERKQLLQQVPAGAAESTLEASTRLADITAIAQQLHDNSAAEFRTYMQFGSAYRRGVSHCLVYLLTWSVTDCSLAVQTVLLQLLSCHFVDSTHQHKLSLLHPKTLLPDRM